VNFVEVAQLIARDEISEHGEERERKAEEHRDAADARFRLFVHPPLADFVDHTDVSREFAHEGRRECRRDAREQNDDAEDRQQRKRRQARVTAGAGTCSTATPASANNADAISSG